MTRRRFFIVWGVFTLIYLAFVTLAPTGQAPQSDAWPLVNHHHLQALAWVGLGVTGQPEPPRLDITPQVLDVLGREQPVEVEQLQLPVDLVFLRVTDTRSADDRSADARTALTELAQKAQGASPEAAQLAVNQFFDNYEFHVGFPLGPAFLLTPLVALLGPIVAVQWLAALLGGLAVACMDRLIFDWLAVVRPAHALPLELQNLLVVLIGLGTLFPQVLAQATVWHFAQTVAVTCLTAALLLAIRRQPFFAGLALAIAITSRPTTLLAVPLVWALLWWARTRLPRTTLGEEPENTPSGETPATAAPRPYSRRLLTLDVIKLTLVPLTLLVLHAGLNYARFAAPLKVGYSYLNYTDKPAKQLAEYGQFSLRRIPINAYWLLLAWPKVPRDTLTDQPVAPYIASDPEGMGVFFVTPAYLLMFIALFPPLVRQRLVQMAWLALVGVTLPALMYFNTGWVQWGGRFLLDSWPIWLMLTAAGLVVTPKLVRVPLVLLSVASNMLAVGFLIFVMG